jgi:hypothetical protein
MPAFEKAGKKVWKSGPKAAFFGLVNCFDAAQQKCNTRISWTRVLWR